jgi:ribosomal protein S19
MKSQWKVLPFIQTFSYYVSRKYCFLQTDLNKRAYVYNGIKYTSHLIKKEMINCYAGEFCNTKASMLRRKRDLFNKSNKYKHKKKINKTYKK